MRENQRSPSGLRSFPPTFWVANLMELFERGAYYGLQAVLAIYLTTKVAEGGLGFSESGVGFLQSIVYSITYIAPIFGGALAEKFGYRKMLLWAFSLLAIGYFAAGQSSLYGLVFASLLVMAAGSGLFKPIITGTVARTTTKANSGLGFGIYYWSINLGAFLAPLFISIVKEFRWTYVFLSSSIWCALMLLPALFLYREPAKAGEGRSRGIKDVMRGALEVLGDSRFMLMICIYSCFWILYFQNFGSVLWYLQHFIDKTPVDTHVLAPINSVLDRMGAFFHIEKGKLNWKFGAEFVTIINAATIILLQVVVSTLVKKIKALPTMAAGIIIGSTCFVFLAFSSSPWIFIAGIVVFSIGEMTCHPKYYSYVGAIAPADKVAVYMGYAFLYGVIGSLVGSSAGAEMYEGMLKSYEGLSYAAAGGTIRSFWLIFALLGILTMLALLLFNRFFSEDTRRTNFRTWQIMLGIYCLLIGLGIFFFIYNLTLAQEFKWRTLLQSLILLLLGSGGLCISLKTGRKRWETQDG